MSRKKLAATMTYWETSETDGPTWVQWTPSDDSFSQDLEATLAGLVPTGR